MIYTDSRLKMRVSYKAKERNEREKKRIEKPFDHRALKSCIHWHHLQIRDET